MTQSVNPLRTSLAIATALAAVLAPAGPAHASARTITMIGSDAGLPNLHLIYLTSQGLPFDYVQWPGQTPLWRGAVVPTQTNAQTNAPPLAASSTSIFSSGKFKTAAICF